MKCPHCGGENPIHQQYCVVCGSKIEVAFSAVAESVKSDADRRSLARRPATLAQVLGLLLAANIAFILMDVSFNAEPLVGEPDVPSALPPDIVFDPPVEVAIPQLEDLPEVMPLPMPKLAPRTAKRFGWRREPLRSTLHVARGGDPAVLESVSRGLDCLVRHQERDGSWKVRGGWNLGRVAWGDPAVTGLSVLALLGDGHVWTTDGDALGLSAGRGIRSLVSIQDESGRIGSDTGHYMYNHGIATAALCEAYAMTGMGLLREPAAKAVAFIVAAQSASGGWGFTADTDGLGDLSVTAWQVAALRSARLAGLEVPDEVLTRALSFVRSLTSTSTGWSAHQAGAGVEPGSQKGVLATAVSLATRVALGESITAEVPRMQVLHLTAEDHLPRYDRAWRSSRGIRSAGLVYYYYYHGSMAMASEQSTGWSTWYGSVIEALRTSQEKDGSWPIAGMGAAEGGRIYATALSVLALETTYRYP